MVLFLLTQKSTRPRSLSILNIGLMIFMATPVESLLRVVYFVSVIWSSWLIKSVRCCFFSSISKDCILSLGLCAADKRFFIDLGILNWWILPLSWTFGITFFVTKSYVPKNHTYLNICDRRLDRISLEKMYGYIPFSHIF